MNLYRIETDSETKGYEWWRRKDECLTQAKAIQGAGIGCQAQKIDVPTKADDLVDFLNLADSTAGNLAEVGIGVTVIGKFPAKGES